MTSRVPEIANQTAKPVQQPTQQDVFSVSSRNLQAPLPFPQAGFTVDPFSPFLEPSPATYFYPPPAMDASLSPLDPTTQAYPY